MIEPTIWKVIEIGQTRIELLSSGTWVYARVLREGKPVKQSGKFPVISAPESLDLETQMLAELVHLVAYDLAAAAKEITALEYEVETWRMQANEHQ